MGHWLSMLSEAAVAATPVETNAYADLSLMTKGLLTTVVGLLGVFLVLTLYYATIKLMQRIKAKNQEN